jgi:hypothetical protein
VAQEPPGFFITPNIAPRLVYAHSDGQSTTNVDRIPVDDPRERALCRALLTHALQLLDELET